MRSRIADKLPKELLTVSQVAAKLSVHPNTVRRWAELGILSSCRIGPRGDRRFHQADIERLVRVERPGRRLTLRTLSEPISTNGDEEIADSGR